MLLDAEQRIIREAPAETSAKPPPRIEDEPGDRLFQSAGSTPIAKILVPVDLSPRSLQAAAYAASLAAALASGLVFVHVLRNGWPLGPAEKEVRDRIAAGAGAHRFLFREGPPAKVILRTAEAEKAGLILMAAHGKSALSRVFEGSIAAMVLREARCAVLVGLDNLAPLSDRPIRSILCGLSPGPRASAVMSWSAELARRLDARLSVIHASTALEPNAGLPCDGEGRRWLEKIAAGEARTVQTGAGMDAAVWLEPGKPLAAIPPLADRLQADLLVVGKSPRRRLLGDLRTLSYEIACRTSCPVASV